MKNVYIILFVFVVSVTFYPQRNSVINNSSADQTQIQFTSSNLPIVIINTNGQDITSDEKITADMGIIFNGEGVRNYLTNPYNNYNGKIGIEIRGSSSQSFPKKQYAVETRDSLGEDLDVSLLGFPEESDWILFAPYNDKSLMRDVLIYKLASDMGRYASRSKYCEVVLNNEYVGVYVLLEKVKRDNDRVNIKKLEPTDITGDAITGGYIIKIDKTDGEEVDGWYSTYLPYPQSQHSIFYQYHYPKPDEIVQQQKDYIKSKIFSFETMMAFNTNISDSADGYPKFLDADSFVDFVLVNEVAKNVDAYRLSTYLYKDRDSRNTKIFAGPVWDFNLGFGNADYYNGWTTNGWQLEYLSNYETNMGGESFLIPNWWLKLFQDSLFQNKVYARWQNVKANIFNTQKINHYIDSLTILLDESKTRNFEKWPVLGVWVWPNYYVFPTYAEEVAFLKSWINNRLNWMNINMVGEPSGVENSENEIPLEFSLEQNYPNPFNPVTTISFALPISIQTKVTVYDILGREVQVLKNDFLNAGYHRIVFNANDLSSGVYFYKIETSSFSKSKQMLLLK